MTDKHIAPAFRLDAFNCPHCGAYAEQKWVLAIALRGAAFGSRSQDVTISDVAISLCLRCKNNAVWIEDATSYEPMKELLRGAHTYPPDIDKLPKAPTKGRLIYPDVSTAPMPHDDMPEDVKKDYEEARTIVSRSPRGAVALLRLCVQKLMPHLGEKGKNINDDIASLVKKGLSDVVQQALDSLRVVGNNAVHPGQIDLKDDVDIALKLFRLLNFIVEKQISEPKQIAEFYSGNVPQSNQDSIGKRDGKK